MIEFIHEELELSVDREEVKELVEKLENDIPTAIVLKYHVTKNPGQVTQARIQR